MKAYFERYSFYAFRMIIDQIALAIFGLVLALATAKADNTALRLVAGFGSVLFYLFLLYTLGWEIGNKDKNSVHLGLIENRPLTGFWISLLANLVNILLAVFFTVGYFAGNSTLMQIGSIPALLLEGMYTGLLSFSAGGSSLNTYWFMYFVIVLPALVVSTVSYLMGYHEIMLTPLMKVQYPKSDRPTRGEKK